ncbi:hypothetical protein N5B55_05925 [Ralstonia pickettii]|uniref:PDC sensor domain-containing protein n=1 Tax=Ralstonia pickettii TaxID=329 RepID=UPI0027151822|nr:hypothetical protein [Ralstonia pickettii]WKZ86485.1 hypothetical protein N5B55_05925 [Ralstonia pickettii]
MRPTLKFQAAAITTLLVVCMLAVFAISQRGRFRADLEALVVAHQKALVHEASSDLRERLDEYLGIVQRTAAHTASVSFESAEQEATYFASVRPMSALFDGVFLVNSEGRVTAVSPSIPGVVGLDVHDRDYFKQVMIVGQPTISEPLHNRVGGAPNVVMAAPISDAVLARS